MSLRAAIRPHVGPLAALAALDLLVFFAAVFGGRVFFERDISAYWHPQVATFVWTIARGSWPLWDSYEGFGLPLLADPSSQVAYPFTWLNLLLPPVPMYTLLVVIHSFWAGAGAYLLARRHGLDRVAATVAGGAFLTSGPLVSAASLHHHFCGAAWIPWVLVGAEVAISARTPRAAAWLALAAAGQALAGSAEMCLFSALALLLRLPFLASDMPWPERRAAGRTLLAATALAASLAAVQWLPTVDLVRTVGRAGFQRADNLFWSVHPAALADAVVPRLLADVPLSVGTRERLLYGREPFLTSLYAGVVGLGAAFLARGGPARYWTACAVLFGLLALGQYFAPAAALLSTFPFRLLRYPAKYLLPAALFWSLLVGSGIQGLRRNGDPRERRVAIVASALLIVASACALGAFWLGRRPVETAARLGAHPEFLDWAAVLLRRKLHRVAIPTLAAALLLFLGWRSPRRRSWAAIGLAAVVGGDLLANARLVNSLAPPELFSRPSAALPLLGPDFRGKRILSEETGLAWTNAHFTAGPPGWPRDWSWVLGAQGRLAPPTGARWGLRGSYDADFTGLARKTHAVVSSAVQANAAAPGAGIFTRRMLQLGGVDAVVAIQRPFPGLPLRGEFRSVYDVPVRVFAVPEPMPLAYVVGGQRVAGNVMELLHQLGSADFDPTQAVILEPPAEAKTTPASFRGHANIVEWRPDHLVVDVQATHPAQLVVVEAYQAAWRAQIDGQPARVEPANGLFRGVAIPAGAHRIEMWYRPWSAVAGAFGTLAGALVAAQMLLARRRRGP
jgi:hypothetical protein